MRLKELAILNFARRLWHHDWLQYFLKPQNVQVQFIAIGAQKSGTTALYKYFAAHPELQAPELKELNYFNGLGHNAASIEAYTCCFKPHYSASTANMSIDVSPNYMLDADKVASNIAHIFPDMKIIVLLREPIARAKSAWFMYKRYYRENEDWFIEAPWVVNNVNPELTLVRRGENFGQSFADDIRDEINALKQGMRIEYPIVEYGLYAKQLRAFIDTFGRDNIHIIENTALLDDTQNCLDEICDFVLLPRYTLSDSDLKRHFVGLNKEAIADTETEQLRSFYAKQNESLEHLVGKKLCWM